MRALIPVFGVLCLQACEPAQPSITDLTTPYHGHWVSYSGICANDEPGDITTILWNESGWSQQGFSVSNLIKLSPLPETSTLRDTYNTKQTDCQAMPDLSVLDKAELVQFKILDVEYQGVVVSQTNQNKQPTQWLLIPDIQNRHFIAYQRMNGAWVTSKKPTRS